MIDQAGGFGRVGSKMGGGARPAVVVASKGQSGAHGVCFNVAKGPPQVCGADRAREESILPEMAGAAASRIQVLRVSAVEAAEEDGEGVRMAGRDNPVHMVRHEAPGVDADLGLFEIRLGEPEVGEAVGAGEEDVFAVYPALRDVVGKSGFDTSSISWHTDEGSARRWKFLKRGQSALTVSLETEISLGQAVPILEVDRRQKGRRRRRRCRRPC